MPKGWASDLGGGRGGPLPGMELEGPCRWGGAAGAQRRRAGSLATGPTMMSRLRTSEKRGKVCSAIRVW